MPTRNNLTSLNKMIPENLNEETDGGLPPRTGSPSSDTPETDDFYCNPPENEAAYEFAQKLERERNRFERMIDHITDIGVYPAKIIGGPTAYEKRSEWQEGWNAATTDVIKRYEESARPGWIPPENAKCPSTQP